MNPRKKLTMTVALPTCYGQESLVHTAESIHTSREVGSFVFYITADSVKLSGKVKKRLKDLGVSVTENSILGTQLKKIKQMIKKTHTDLLVLTQDDVRFDTNSLRALHDMFVSDPALTMTSAVILPEHHRGWFEQILNVGLNISQNVSRQWNDGDNYLCANGRCLAFRVSALKTFSIPDKVVNSDAYFYFENRRNGGSFRQCTKALVYHKTPHTPSEQIRQSRRFMYSKDELASYFGKEIAREYMIPKQLVLKYLLHELLSKPLHTVAYLWLQLYIRFAPVRANDYSNPFWKVNVSTK